MNVLFCNIAWMKYYEGMSKEEAIARLEGIRCGAKSTSCPDQLAKALKQAQ